MYGPNNNTNSLSDVLLELLRIAYLECLSANATHVKRIVNKKKNTTSRKGRIKNDYAFCARLECAQYAVKKFTAFQKLNDILSFFPSFTFRGFDATRVWAGRPRIIFSDFISVSFIFVFFYAFRFRRGMQMFSAREYLCGTVNVLPQHRWRSNAEGMKGLYIPHPKIM